MLEIIPVFWQQFKDNKRRVLLYRGGVSRRRCVVNRMRHSWNQQPPKKKRVCVYSSCILEKKIYIYISRKQKYQTKRQKGAD